MSMSEVAVVQAVEEALRAASAGDEDRRWELVGELQVHGGRHALDVASRLSGHPESSHRALSADVLSQLGAGTGRPAVDGPFRDEALALLLTMVEGEQDPAVLNAVAVGFGHLGDERSVQPLVRMLAHPDVKVRSGVVFGLLGRQEAAALEALMSLSADTEPEVRDWATFGLARRTDQDFPQLREALADRLADSDPDTLAEAIHGLAVRGDERATTPLLNALQSSLPCSDPNVLLEALYALATATGDLRLLPHLVADRDSWFEIEPGDELPDDLRAALARYAPAEEH